MDRRAFAKLLLAAPALLANRSAAARLAGVISPIAEQDGAGGSSLASDVDALLKQELVIDIAASDHFYYLPKQHKRAFDPEATRRVIGGAALGIGTLTGAMPTFLPENSLLRKSPVIASREGTRPVESPAGAVERMLKEFESIHRAVEAHPNAVGLALRADDLKALHGQGKMGLVIGLDTGYEIDSNLLVLEEFYRLGLRKMALTHEVVPPWAESDRSDDPRGLRPFGRDVIAECNRLGIMVDVSHSSDRTFWAALECSRRPIIATHSGARKVANVARNMDDEMIRAMAKKGGVIGIGGALNQKTIEKYLAAGWYEQSLLTSLWFMQKYPNPDDLADAWYDPEKQKEAKASLGFHTSSAVAASSEMVDFESTLAHLDYMTKLIGFDHLGIGTDLEMTDPKYPAIIRGFAAGLLERKYSEENIRKLLGGNFLRIFSENERSAS